MVDDERHSFYHYHGSVEAQCLRLVNTYLADKTSVAGDHKENLASQNYDRKTEVKIAWDAESTPEKHLEQIITQK